MKRTFKFFEILLLMCGVFGADEVKSVSVMEGDSVTLNHGFTQIQGVIQILWRFGEPGLTIAQIDENGISFPDDERFKDRLQLNQTGSLTIKNMRIKHSGLYKLKIDHNTGTSDRKFSVAVYESPSDIAGGEAEMKSVSVKEGDPVTLHVPEIQGNELIVWRFGDEEKLIAKHDIEAKSSPLYYEERFRDRLQLNDQTGSLIITNTRTTDSGLYKAKISSNKQTSYKKFTVTVTVPDSGYSPAAVAGIVVGVLLVAAAAVAAGVMYYCSHRTSNLPNKTLSVRKGDPVTLNPDTEIQTGDEIQWLFGAGDTLIAEIKGEAREIKVHDPDWRFLGRLELDKETGSLTIRNTKAAFTGVYTLKIRRGRETLYKRLIVSVEESEREVAMGEYFTLNTATEINKDDWIQWRFNNEKEATIIAEIKTRKIFKYDGPDGTFRDGLELDKETGSLTITNTRTEHSGFYTLKIRKGTEETLYKSFCISVREWMVAEMEGESVTLKPATEINKDDSIQWLYGDEEQQTVIAEFTGETEKIFTYAHVADGRFRDRLELDKTTGSLTIKNTRTAHSGFYHLQIRSSSGLSYQTFSVTVKDKVEKKLLIGEDSVTLNPDTEIQRDDQILWMFGDQDKLIAQIKGGTGKLYGDANERFRGRLELNEKTGSLTITKIEAEHLGLYKVLTISSSGGTLCKKFRVSINLSYVERRKGEYVRLYTGLTEILTDDEIQWMYGDENSLIAKIKGGTGKRYDGPDGRFRGSLELNNQTGDLTISNSTAEHAGDYKLKIRSSNGNTNSTYIVIIKVRDEKVTAGDSFRLYTGLIVKKTDLIQWMFGDENTLLAGIKGGTGKTYDGPDGRFRDSLELNTLTGSLTINNSTAEHAGDYKLKIRSSKGNANSTYTVIIKGAAVTDEVREKSSMKEKNESRVSKSATVVMPLLNGEDVDVVNEEEGTSSL